MTDSSEKWKLLINILQSIQTELQLMNQGLNSKVSASRPQQLVHVAFRGCEIYLLHKAFIDAGGAPHEKYKTLLEKTVPYISNKTQRGFSAQSCYKYSDKVDPEARDNVKRFLQRMIRNIDSYD